MIEFGRLDKDGTYTHIRTLSQSTMLKCPHCIMVPDHYRADNSCRCDDPDHIEMKEWEYVWNDKTRRWE